MTCIYMVVDNNKKMVVPHSLHRSLKGAKRELDKMMAELSDDWVQMSMYSFHHTETGKEYGILKYDVAY